jgi:NADH-quinone oxidoreductase subunit L
MLATSDSGAAALQEMAPATGIFSFIWVIVALPLLGSALLLLGGRRTNKWGHLLAILMVWASFALGVSMFVAMLAGRVPSPRPLRVVCGGDFNVPAAFQPTTRWCSCC